MLSPNLTLNDFVCPIPICQLETDLGSILRIFQHSDCDLLAIPQENNSWGTISSKKLLSLIGQFWQNKTASMIGHPKNVTHGETLFRLGSQELNCLIEPATVYQSDTKIENFLGYWKRNSLANNQTKYLIVNHQGNLQGLLNTEKLLEFLVSKFHQSQAVYSSLPVLPISLINSLDSIALPLKLETLAGENFYVNQHWQKLVGTSEEITPQQPQSEDCSIASWWGKQQLSEHQQNVFSETNNQDNPIEIANAINYQCLTASLPLNNLSRKLSLNLDSEYLPTAIPEHFVPSCLLDNPQINPAANSTFSIQIEQKKDWSYIKIPLAIAPQKLQDTTTSIYWLILAIKQPLEGSEDNSLPKTLAVPETIADQLLATISHELKSPLTGIVGLSSLLKTQKLGQLNQRQTRYMKLIHGSGKRLMNIVNDLLELTSLATGKLPLQPEIVNLESLCRQAYQQVVTKLEPTTAAKLDSDFIGDTPQFQINIESGLGLAIADKSRLSSILSHLILETIQFSEPLNNKLEIKIKYLEDWTAIVISNDLETVFLSSEQVVSQLPPFPEDAASLKQQSGLNLTIAKYLAKVLGGDVLSIYSASSCQFTLLLPGDSSQLTHLSANLSPVVKQEQHHDREGWRGSLAISNRGVDKNENAVTKPRHLTILCIYPEPEVINSVTSTQSGLNFNLKSWAEQDWSTTNEQQLSYQHRIIEADGLEQAHTLARIWQLDVIVLDGYKIVNPSQYLRSLQESEYLSALPLITLDTRTTEAANQIDGLNVYPCLLPAECRSVRDLMQVIQIATGLEH